MQQPSVISAVTSARLELGDWTVEPQANALRHRNGRRIRLEGRAMRLLELLLARAGEVVSGEELLDEVWGRTAISPHSVAVVISSLRKALGDDARRPRYIETIPKRGYRLRADAIGGNAVGRHYVWPATAAGLVVVGLTFALFAIHSYSLPADAAADRALQARYFQARQLWSRRDHDDVSEALRLLEGIVDEHADFAPAHAALADIYAHKTGEHIDRPALDTFRASQRHLDRAMAIDPEQPELYVTQALLAFYRDHRPAAALGSLQQALEREPRLALAWQTRAMVLSALGEHDLSLQAIGRARALDPVSASIGWDEVWFLYLAGRYEAAFDTAEQAARYSPPNHLYLALIEHARGRSEAALEHWLTRFERKGIELADPTAIRRSAALSASDAYAALLEQLEAVPEYREYAGVRALWQLWSGDADAALATLAAAPPDRDHWMQIWLHEMPAFAPLLHRPEMRALIERTGIAQTTARVSE